MVSKCFASNAEFARKTLARPIEPQGRKGQKGYAKIYYYSL